MNFEYIHKLNIFLLDGAGALLTAALLSFLLVPFSINFGLPPSNFQFLAGLAGIFALYSFTCYFLAGKRWTLLLGIICSANLLYCIATASLLYVHRETISLLALLYFAGEIAVVLALCFVELQLIRKNRYS